MTCCVKLDLGENGKALNIHVTFKQVSDSFLRSFVMMDKDLGCQLAILPSEQKVTYALGVRKGFQYELVYV